MTNEKKFNWRDEAHKDSDTVYTILKNARFFVASYLSLAEATDEYNKIRAEKPEWSLQLVSDGRWGDTEPSRLIKNDSARAGYFAKQ